MMQFKTFLFIRRAISVKKILRKGIKIQRSCKIKGSRDHFLAFILRGVLFFQKKINQTQF